MTTTTSTSTSGSPTGKVALVAGASRGIGADTARAFARDGYAVVLGARDHEALAGVAADIEQRGGRAVTAVTDVADTDSMRALVDLAVSTYGRLDAAFNNATDGPMPAPLADLDPDDRPRHPAQHARTFLGMKYEIPAMLDSGGGAISTWPGRRRAGDDQPRRVRAGQGGIIGLPRSPRRLRIATSASTSLPPGRS
jgi:NAD(P)-dependent dehydrogenase (short-subunit alcohol dehydrogenase family)